MLVIWFCVEAAARTYPEVTLSNAHSSSRSAEACPTRRAVALFSDRWSTRVLAALATGPLGFNEIQRRLETVSSKVLTQTLRRQESAGVLSRTLFETVPMTVEYALTPFGQSVLEQINGLRDWADAHLDDLGSEN